MRAALLVTAAYDGSTQIPSLPSATIAAADVERRCSESDCAFKTKRLATERQLPLLLSEALAQLDGISTLFVYFGGYVTISQDRGSALLLDGPRLKALQWSKVRTLLRSANARTLVIVDAVAMPGTQAPIEQLSASIGSSLVDSNGTISALVAVRAAFAHPPEVAHFANLIVAVSEYLSVHSTSGSVITERALFDAMRQERACFWRLGSAALYPGRGDFPFAKARGNGVEAEQLPSWQLDEVESTSPALPTGSDPPLPAFSLNRPSSAPQPSPNDSTHAQRESGDDVDTRDSDSDLEVPTPRRASVVEKYDATRQDGALSTATPLAARALPTQNSSASPPSAEATPGHSARLQIGADGATSSANPVSNAFELLRDSRSGVRRDDLDPPEDSSPNLSLSEPNGDLRYRATVGVRAEGPVSSSSSREALQSSDQNPQLSSETLRPSSEPAPARETVPDSIPPSIPSAAWSGLYHPEFDDNGYAPDGEPDEGESRGDSDAPELDAEQLLRAAVRRPVGRVPESGSAEPELAVATAGLPQPSPALPAPPLGAMSPPPPPGAVRRTLAPPPSRVRTQSHAPPAPMSNHTEEFAPVSSRELQAAVLAHLDSAERRAAASDQDTAIEHLKRALALGIPDLILQAEVRCKLAGMLIAQERTTDALTELERAAQLDPNNPTACVQLIELLRKLGRHVRLREVCVDRLDSATDPEERLAFIDVLAELDLDHGDTDLAVRLLRKRLEAAPAVRPLGRLCEAHQRAGNWAALVETQIRLADALAGVPERQALALAAAARIAARHLADESRAVALVERAWKAETTTIERLLEAADFCESQMGVSALIRLYESVLGHLTNLDSVVSLAIACSRLCQQKLHDPARAAHAISAALHLAPDAATLRVELSRLYHTLGARDLADEQARAALLLEPILPDAFAALSIAVRDAERTDLAWRAASVAVSLGSSDEATVALAREFAQGGLTTPNRALSADDWTLIASTQYPPPPSTQLGRCLLLIEPAVKAAHIKSQGSRPDWMESAQEIDLAASTATLARTVVWASRFTGSEAPRLWIADEVAHAGRLEVAPEPSLLVSRALTSGLTLVEFAFLSARILTYARPEWCLLGFLGGPNAAFDWLELCIAIAAERPAPPSAPATRKVTGILQAQLPTEARTELLNLRQRTTDEQLRNALAALCAHATRVAGRVGLLACGDPGAALTLCKKLPLGHLSLTEQLVDLSAFAISPDLGDLRESLGITFDANRTVSASIPAPAPP